MTRTKRKAEITCRFMVMKQELEAETSPKSSWVVLQKTSSEHLSRPVHYDYEQDQFTKSSKSDDVDYGSLPFPSSPTNKTTLSALCVTSKKFFPEKSQHSHEPSEPSIRVHELIAATNPNLEMIRM